ncbi:asparaginase [Geosporobacter ferrireducens]|uniref:L-asparaginase n=1 Tax=Geosporobacter ferrireducens TaxID=1424294 RepID=A0A1D8GLD7_9FIRM|nr:asparaginase [Geosporobacter ferrireducens]AOT71717.1 L-asparaginase [Geosporobacter ferrireducens]MTI55493.1 asparaginase [Geosporobacter ferrireducens]
MKPLVVLTRSHRVESIHSGAICISDYHNQLQSRIGNEQKKIYLRSSAKPFQAVALAASGSLEKFGISLEELSVICSSHSGEDFHRQAVYSILQKIGLTEEDLDCGICNPYNPEMLTRITCKQEKPSQLFNCCSGKHAGMLALCRFYGYPTKGYVEKTHPVQQLILNTIASLLNIPSEEIVTGQDGCGVPNFMISLQQAAYLYALLAAGEKGHSQYGFVLSKIANAMLAYPRMINGDSEFCTELINYSGRKVIGKVGGEGVYCLAIPEKGLGAAVKIADGNERAVYPVALHILRQLGLTDREMEDRLVLWAFPPIKDHRGNIIGYTLPVFDVLQGTNEAIKIGDNFVFKGECLWKH